MDQVGDMFWREGAAVLLDPISQWYPSETNARYDLTKKTLLVKYQTSPQQSNFGSMVVFPLNLYGPRRKFNAGSSYVRAAFMIDIHISKKLGPDELSVCVDGSSRSDFFYVEYAEGRIILEDGNNTDILQTNLGSGQEPQ